MLLADALGDKLESELRLVLLAIALAFGASVVVFWALIKRWTSGRQWVALSDWAREHGFALHRAERVRLPSSLRATQVPAQPVLALSDARTTIIQFDTDSIGGGGGG